MAKPRDLLLFPLSLLLLLCTPSTPNPPPLSSSPSTSSPLDVFLASGKGGGPRGAPISFWCCSMVVTNRNTTLLFAQASVPGNYTTTTTATATSTLVGITGGYVGKTVVTRSSDSGHTWSSQVDVPPLVDPHGKINFGGQAVYAPAAGGPNGTVYLFATPAYLHSHSMSPITANHSAATFLTKSTDDGHTWSPLQELPAGSVWGTGEASGMVITKGPHAGRLLLPRIPDPFGPKTPRHADRAFAMFSDDGGATWQKGASLPEGYTEAEAAEIGSNGSVLWTSRLGPPYTSRNPGVLRGFARSDDGGATWAETWQLPQNNADGVLFGTCESSLVGDPATGAVYWSHPGAWPPGNRSRTNYTVHASNDGKHWSFVQVVYPGGSGYSDSAILPDGRLGVAFQRTLYESGVEGGGYNGAFAALTRPSGE